MTNPDLFPNLTPRDQLTAGLRQLADYLDTHPAIPVATFGWDLYVSTCGASDHDGIAAIDRIAEALGVTVDDDRATGGHYTATKTFGPVSYGAFHIPARRRAAHRALMTYYDSITPDDAGPDDPPQAA